MVRTFLSAAFVFFLAFAGQGFAATWYVSTAGNDANPGSLASPFRTITRGASMARPGDVVSVRGGVYNEIVRASVKGTALARITIEPYAGEKAIIDGAGTAANTDLVQLGSAEYLDFKGFEVRNSNRLGIVGWGAKNLRILNNTVTRAWRGGIYVGHDLFGNTYDITIDGNTVFNNVVMNETHNMTSGGWGQSISVQYVDRANITRNRVYQNDGEGIVVLLSDNVLVQSNEVSDSFSVGIYLDNAQYTKVDANLVYSSGDTRYYRNGFPAAGIGTANESYGTLNRLTNLTITNNIVVDTRWGFYYGAYEAAGGLKNTTVANNTFHRSAAAMVWIEADAHSGNVFQSNIFHQAGGGVMLLGSASGSTFRSNNWYGGNAGAAAGYGDVLSDPRLSNAGGRGAADYKLTADSPLLMAGVVLPAISTDFWGAPRVEGFDIGAHQYSGSVAPPADTEAPSSPANLTATPSAATPSISLQWSAASDNTGVTGYTIARNGTVVASVTGTTWIDAGLIYATQYSYSVTASDASGNVSAAATATAVTKVEEIADTQAPSVPGNFWVTPSSSSTRMYLQWGASTDDNAVTAYRIYRNGTLVATVNTTGWTDDSVLEWSTSYQYGISAIDAAGNASAQATASGTTIADPVGIDTQAPTMPGGFWVTPSSSSTRMYLSWKASTDNIGVTGYRIYRNGQLVATVTGLTWTDDNNLRRRTTFTWAIEAFDAAGNVSTQAKFTATTKK